MIVVDVDALCGNSFGKLSHIACDCVHILYPTDWLEGGTVCDQVEEHAMLAQKLLQPSANDVDRDIVLQVEEAVALVDGS